MSYKYKTIVITGPTGSGKTQISIELGKLLCYPIVNMDSKQFYNSNKILSASPTDLEKNTIPHFLFNHIPYNQKYSLGQWVEDIRNIDKKILVGGSIFYLKSLMAGIPMVNISTETKNFINNITDKYNYLKSLIPNTFIHQNDEYRINRLLEFYIETGYDFHTFPNKYKEDMYIIYIDAKNIEQRIIQRTNNIFNSAVSEFLVDGYHKELEVIIGYKDIYEYINGNVNMESCINNININTLNYVKYQRKTLNSVKCNYYIDDINKIDYNKILSEIIL